MCPYIFSLYNTGRRNYYVLCSEDTVHFSRMQIWSKPHKLSQPPTGGSTEHDVPLQPLTGFSTGSTHSGGKTILDAFHRAFTYNKHFLTCNHDDHTDNYLSLVQKHQLQNFTTLVIMGKIVQRIHRSRTELSQEIDRRDGENREECIYYCLTTYIVQYYCYYYYKSSQQVPVQYVKTPYTLYIEILQQTHLNSDVWQGRQLRLINQHLSDGTNMLTQKQVKTQIEEDIGIVPYNMYISVHIELPPFPS